MSLPVRPRLHWLAAAAIFLGMLAIFSRDNRFPHFYHTDEPSKVRQILSGQRNGRHPTLLLNSASLILKITGWTPTRDHAAWAGRWASAIFAAAAVALFFLWAARVGGWPAGTLAALFAGLQPGLLTAAHYVKEDPALLLGLAATTLAARFFAEKPNARRALWLGAAAGLAVAGKWIGVVALLGAASQIWLARQEWQKGERWKVWLALAVGALGVFLLIDFDLVRQWNAVQQGVSSEVTSFYANDAGAARSFHFFHYLQRLPEVFSWPLLLLAAGEIVWLWRKPAPAHLRLIALLPPFWGLMISCIPKTENRYLLPLTTFSCVLAALAAAQLLRWARQKGALVRGLARLLCTGLVLSLLPDFREAASSFRHDHHRELVAWIERKLPAKAIIAQDSRVALPSPGDARFEPDEPQLRQKVLTPGRRYASDYGDLAALRARGVTHVALFLSNYLVLVERDGDPLDTPQKQQAAAFYRELQRSGRKVFVRRKGSDRYLSVALVLYEIAPPPRAGD